MFEPGRLDLAGRAAATDRVIRRFDARPFDWRTRSTCIHLARAQLRALGHRPPRVPDFRSPIGARRALAATSHATLGGLLDAMLPRIAPLRLIVGDIAIVAGDEEFGAIVIALGGDVVKGWHRDDLSGLRAMKVTSGSFAACYAVGRPWAR